MKKVIALILTVVLVFGLAGCDKEESPEQAVTNMFAAINNDIDAASKYIDYDGLLNMGESSEETSAAESEEMLKVILEQFDYKIISSSEDGDSATVTAEITNIDMKSILADFVSEAFALAFSGLDEETMDKQMDHKFTELLNRNDNETVTSTVDIKLTKAENSWKVDMSDELADAIFGGMISAAENMNHSFGGSSESDSDTDKLSEIDNWLIGKIWNDGFCDISHYISTGTSSIGETLDIDFTLDQLGIAMEKKSEYDSFINELNGEEYSQVKSIWNKLSSEIDTLYDQVNETKPVAKDSNNTFDTGKFVQYRDAFSDAINGLD